MNTTIESPPLEIIPAGVELAEETKLSIQQGFAQFFTKAQELIAQAGNITSPKMARVARLEFKALRVSAEKARKSLKEESIRYGKAVDGANNILLAAIVPHEERLEEIEKAEERRIAAEVEARRVERYTALLPYGAALVADSPALGTMPQSDFDAILADAKALHEARMERERKAEEERLAREVAEAKERERVRLENEKLLREAAEREAAAKLERERAAQEKAALEAKMAQERAEAERLRLEAEAEANRVREAEVEAQRVEFARQQKIEDAKRAKAEAKAQAEAQRLRVEAEAAAAIAAEERQKAEALAEAERQRVAAEEAKKREEAEAAEKAAQAPDREKLLQYAKALLSLPTPAVKTAKARKIVAAFITDIQDMAESLRGAAEKL